MNSTAELLLEYLGNLLYTPDDARLDVETLPEDFRELGQGLLVFQESLRELRVFALALGRGNLAVEAPVRNELAAPLKTLHANLRHLTWQSQQVAKGDYQQKVQFLGEFADAFNAMIHQLDERRGSLLEEIERGRQKTLALEQSANLFTSLTELVPQWIIVLAKETKEVLFSNQAARGILATDDELVARLQEWLGNYIDRNENSLFAETVEGAIRLQRRLENRVGDLEHSLFTETVEIATAQKTWFLSIAIQPFIWPPHQAVACIISDHSEERKHLQELENVAYRDPLTKVGSRHFGMKVLRDWIDTHVHFCICFVDIDHLKGVNDTFGHPVGDAYITSVANLLTGFSRDVVVSRLGGDEFILLQRDWSEQRAETRLQELQKELSCQSIESNQPYTRGISYGVIEVLPDNITSSSDLLSKADEKMYQFKRAQKKQQQVSSSPPSFPSDTFTAPRSDATVVNDFPLPWLSPSEK